MQKKSLLCAGALCLVLACNKKDYNSASQGYPSIDSVYNEMGAKTQSFTVNAATGASFYGKGGARFIFPPNAFTKNGNPVTGDVQVQVAEYPKISDMIFSKVLTVSNGQPLVSGGEVYVDARQNGEKLDISGTFQVNIPQRSTADSAMQLYTAKDYDSTKSSAINWQLDPTGSVAPVSKDTLAVRTTGTMGNYHNADRGWGQAGTSLQTFYLRLGSPKGISNKLSAYAVYDNYFMVVPLTEGIKDAMITVTTVPNIPVHFIVMGVIDGDFYAGILPATPMTGIYYNLNLNKTKPDDFRALIDEIK